jgi:putative NADH-flavin reductase
MSHQHLTVLVVGATGSIGRLVVEEAGRKGHAVRALARDPRKAARLFPGVEVVAEQSTNYAEPSIADYDERRGPLVEYWKSQTGGPDRRR